MDGDVDGADAGDDEPLGSGVEAGGAMVAVVVPSVVKSVIDVLDGSLRHVVSNPPSAAPPIARMRARREYTTNV